VRTDSGFGNYRQEEPTSYPNDVTADWELVKKYHHAAEAWRVDLSELSQSLAFAFQITVLEKKLGPNAPEVAIIATSMKREFLERYFGTNRDIQHFARDALHEGRSDVAKEVNRAITVLGTPPDADTAQRFIERVRDSMNYNYNAPSTWRGERPLIVFMVVTAAVFIVFILLAIFAHP
jgi:hypothetical protein